MIKTLSATVISVFFVMGGAVAQKYEIPPSSSTYGDVPYISDEAMKECVKLYNEAKWLHEELESTKVNRYSQSSVNAYNRKVKKHNRMNKAFNRDCAGKQSYSAYKAAQDLNEEVGQN